MKKLLVLFFILLLQLPALSITDNTDNVEETILNNPKIIPQETLKGEVSFDEDSAIYLDKSIERPALNIKPPNTLIPVYTPTFKDTRIRERSALAKSSKLSGDEYYIAPIFNYVSEQAGNFSYGTYYGASMDSAQMTYSTSLFTRYDGKRYALTGTINTDSQSIDGSYQSMLGIAPELKLTKALALRDTVKTYMGVPIKKNSISLIYTPQLKKYIDSLRFELGLSQTFYESGYSNASVEFSTKFKL